MAWKSRSVVDERMRFIVALRDGAASFTEVCAQFGISRKTGYKWLARYERDGPTALHDHRAGPRQPPPHATPDAVVATLLDARKEHPRWGPRKLRAWLLDRDPALVLPAPSTIGELLKRHGLVSAARRRRPRVPLERTARLACDRPNAVWCVDFKGHFALGNRSRCYPLTLTDGYSRFLLKCEALARTTVDDVRPHFERAFREFGVPLRLRSDNGPPFATGGVGGLSVLSIWWIKLGVTPERIEPGHPEQNGRHERLHRTLLEVCAPPAADLCAQQLAFDRWRREYNDERPHEALAQTPPVRHYTASPRAMPAAPTPPTYDRDWTVRWADASGWIGFGGQYTHLGKLLAREPVGLEQIGETQWKAWYGPVVLGVLDTRDRPMKLRAVPPRAPPAA